MIAIVDYGLGNLGSILNMLRTIGEKAVITSDKRVLEAADKIILPGVGAFDAGVENLKARGLFGLLQQQAGTGKPMMGICLGMQLLGRKSEEGEEEGLNLIPFDNVRFSFQEDCGLKVPHMGWDLVKFAKTDKILDGIENTQRYYFVHSYHAKCDYAKHVLMSCDYGYEFAAAVSCDHIYGVQFHPEKSHDFGMRLLENFAKRC